MATNYAAFITEKQGKPLKVDKTDLPTPGDDEVVVKSGAIAINPVDWKIQDYGMFIEKYPNILGTDAAGEVVDVGSKVTDFKKGDRVLAHVTGLLTGQPKNGGFQNYVAVAASSIAHIPSSMTYTDATVLPLAISTASCGLFQPETLQLPLPSTSPSPSGKVAVIWGASSSVGSTAVQLAAAAGVDIIATASAHNHDFVQGLGASKVIDYKSASVVDDIVSAVHSSGKEFAGVFDTISEDATIKASVEVLQKVGKSKRLALVLPGTEEKTPKDIEAHAVFAFTIIFKHPEVGKAIWGKFVPEALKNGQLKPLPKAQVVGKGLENVQKGMDANKAGVSARKVVIEL